MTIYAEHPLENAIAEAWPVANWLDSHVLLAVSGGPDSVALLRAVLALKQRFEGPGRLFAGHLHHGLRGAAADNDQAWLERLCFRLEIPLEVGRADVAAAASEQGDGWEAAARQARYDFLCGSAERLGARWVALGHTADDQVETVLHRILRGTGLTGVSGMPRFRQLSPSVTLVRPLLDLPRREVLQYLSAMGQDYRTDASNSEIRWTRNRLRHELLPTIREQFNTDIDQALLRLSAQASESQQLIADAAAKLAAQCVVMEGGSPPWTVKIDCRTLTDEPPLIVREVCKAAWHQAGWPVQAMGYDEWHQLAEMLQANLKVLPINLPGNIQACRDGDLLLLSYRPPVV